MKNWNVKTAHYVILFSILLKLLLQVIASAHSGYHGDEVLHIEAGNHLAFGYMDFPPLIGLLAWIQNLFNTDSIYVNHFFNYMNSGLILLFSGLIILRLGGGVLAVLVTQLAIILSSGFGASQYLFLPTAFEQLFWVVIVYNLILFNDSQKPKYLIFTSVFAAIGFLNKYSIVFLLAGIALSVLLYKREILRQKATWLVILLFVGLISPNLFWQFSNGFPVVTHMSALYESQLNQQSFMEEFWTLVLFLNPMTTILWVAALVMLFHPRFKEKRFPLLTLIISGILLIVSKGKNYYFFPIILCLIAFGAIYFEYLLHNRKWIGYTYLFLLIVFGTYQLPHGIPILKLENYLKAYNLKPNDDNRIPLMFENYYSSDNWDRIFKSVVGNYKSLTNEEKKHCYVWGRHYSMAGHVNLFKQEYELPTAFSFHSSYYEWVSDFDKNVTVIAIGESNIRQQYWEKYFQKVEEIDRITNHYAAEKNWYNYRIYLCREIKYNSEEMKELFKDEIF